MGILSPRRLTNLMRQAYISKVQLYDAEPGSEARIRDLHLEGISTGVVSIQQL